MSKITKAEKPLKIKFNVLSTVHRDISVQHQSTTYQQPVNITHDYINCYLYRVDPPDDEQQACSKHVEAYY
jgi:hypothetical protein